MQTFEEITQTRKQVNLVLITTYDLQASIWSEDLISDVITLSDLLA